MAKATAPRHNRYSALGDRLPPPMTHRARIGGVEYGCS